MTIGSVYIIVVTTITIVTLLLTWLQNRRQVSSLRNQYIKQITSLLLGEQPSSVKILARSRRNRIALAEAIYTVVSHTYGNDTDALRHVVEQNRLERLLLREIHLSHGTRRARMLMLLSAIPLNADKVKQLSHYMHSHDSDIRISALTVALASSPSMAIRTIATFDFALTPFDTARIIALLRRGLLPIAYEPLLDSNNHNLRILGLAIVRSFGIEIAEKHLHKIISAEEDITIVNQTIYTLASLGRPLHHTRIRERLAAMPACKRKELCRHLTVEGYSLSAVRSIFTEQESVYAELLINSYKRALVHA